MILVLAARGQRTRGIEPSTLSPMNRCRRSFHPGRPWGSRTLLVNVVITRRGGELFALQSALPVTAHPVLPPRIHHLHNYTPNYLLTGASIAIYLVGAACARWKKRGVMSKLYTIKNA